jgi:hypothetical protein
MADRTGWIRVRSRLHEDAAVMRAAARLYDDCGELKDLGLSACVTMIEGAVLRLWGYGANYGKRVGKTDDCLVDLEPSMIDHLCGYQGLCTSLDAAGLIKRDKDGTVMPGLLKWVDLVDESREKERVRKQEYRDRHKGVPRDKDGTDARQTRRDRDRDRDRDSKDKIQCATSEKDQTAFEAWWASYPLRRPGCRKGHKATALKLWGALKPTEHARVVQATSAMISAGDLPCDAERFLRPPRGGGEPRYCSWLDGSSTNGPVVSGQSRSAQTMAAREKGKAAYDTSFLTKRSKR